MSPKLINTQEITGVWPFLKSIDWEERWLLALMAVHLLFLGLTIITYNRTNIQSFLFLTFLGLAYFSEKINEVAAENWRLFSGQQYFDSSGLFISIIFSGPLLINCLIIVVCWLWQMANMMVKVKRGQLRQQMKETAEQKTEQSSSGKHFEKKTLPLKSSKQKTS